MFSHYHHEYSWLIEIHKKRQQEQILACYYFIAETLNLIPVIKICYDNGPCS
jgi:hypothetical protein